jgi:hypothetical protein
LVSYGTATEIVCESSLIVPDTAGLMNLNEIKAFASESLGEVRGDWDRDEEL